MWAMCTRFDQDNHTSQIHTTAGSIDVLLPAVSIFILHLILLFKIQPDDRVRVCSTGVIIILDLLSRPRN